MTFSFTGKFSLPENLHQFDVCPSFTQYFSLKYKSFVNNVILIKYIECAFSSFILSRIFGECFGEHKQVVNIMNASHTQVTRSNRVYSRSAPELTTVYIFCLVGALFQLEETYLIFLVI